MNFQLKAAKALQAALVQDHREDHTSYIKLADGSPAWMVTAIREAHEDRLPNDLDYSACSEVVDAMVEVLEAGNSLEDERHERVDGFVPVYNNERLQWLAAHNDHVWHCDEAAAQGLCAKDADTLTRIGAGYYQWYDAKWGVLASAIEDEADCRELEADGLYTGEDE